MYCWNLESCDGYWCNSPENTIEDCLEEARTVNHSDYDDEYNTVFIGELTDCVPRISAENILDDIEEDGYEEWGEASEDWYAYNNRKKDELKELEDKLTEVIHTWMKKYGYFPNFSVVNDVKEYNL